MKEERSSIYVCSPWMGAVKDVGANVIMISQVQSLSFVVLMPNFP